MSLSDKIIDKKLLDIAPNDLLDVDSVKAFIKNLNKEMHELRISGEGHGLGEKDYIEIECVNQIIKRLAGEQLT